MGPVKKERGVTRRRFINYFLGGGLVATAASILYPVLRFITPPKVREATVSNVVVGKVGELPPNSGKIFKFGAKPGILINTPEGELRAFSAICTHLACIVQYRSDFRHIWCACHNGHYDLHGRVISGPPPRPLEEYKVIVQGENIIVSKA
ncbi:MAG: QcrA and Rieske domain-containing protein [bacterium]